jgi:hypothetical protein
MSLESLSHNSISPCLTVPVASNRNVPRRCSLVCLTVPVASNRNVPAVLSAPSHITHTSQHRAGKWLRPEFNLHWTGFEPARTVCVHYVFNPTGALTLGHECCLVHGRNSIYAPDWWYRILSQTQHVMQPGTRLLFIISQTKEGKNSTHKLSSR